MQKLKAQDVAENPTFNLWTDTLCTRIAYNLSSAKFAKSVQSKKCLKCLN